MNRLTLLTLVLLLVNALTILGQRHAKVASKDSVQIKILIEEFYLWYANQIKAHKDEYAPSFVKRNDGMTTLNFEKYIFGLKSHSFTDNLINRRVQQFNDCVNNLSKVKYETFLKFDGLDQYKEIKCDFNNSHEWTRDQEHHDGAELISLSIIDKHIISGMVQFFNISNGRKFIWDYKRAKVTFVLEGKRWMIDDITVEHL